MNILVTDGMDASAVQSLRDAGFAVTEPSPSSSTLLRSWAKPFGTSTQWWSAPPPKYGKST